MRTHRLICVIAGLIAMAGLLSSGSVPAVVGDWEGALSTGDGSLRVVIHLSQAKDESLTGTMDSPDQGVTGIVISSATYKEPSLHVEIERIHASYEGTISKDNSELRGEWKQGGASLLLTFKKVAK